MPDPQHRIAQAARCGGDLALIVAGDYLMHAAGALAALDSESKISPLSSPLGTLAGFVKAAELLRRGFALVVGWTDPEGARPWLGALLLAYHDPEGRLVYAGRTGAGISQAELEHLWRRL